MPPGFAPAAAGLAALAAWIYILLGRGFFWTMRESGAPPLNDNVAQRRIAAVIPARNEAETIGRAVESLLAQDYPGPLRIFVVDDHSADGTAAAALAAGAGRIEIVPAATLPPGWTGKLWAVAEGVRRAGNFRPDYYLFTDADILHAPDNVSGLAARAEAGGFDLVSYMARLQCGALPERALIPAFVFFFFLLYPPAWIARRDRKTAGAAGGCVLIRREALARIGGIEAIRGELIDDCALARAVKPGGPVWLGATRSARSIREYRTFGEIGGMISRSAFTQLNHSAALLAATAAGMALAYLAPPLLAGWGGRAGSGLGIAAWALMSLAFAPTLRFYERSPLWAPLLPGIALFYLGATFHSAFCYWSGRGGTWKGRVQAAKRG